MLSLGKSIGCVTALIIGIFALVAGGFVLFLGLSIPELPFGQDKMWEWMWGEASEPPYNGTLSFNESWEGEGGQIRGLPAEGKISARFHDPNYLAHFGSPHTGVDIAVPEGTQVRATMGGKVVVAGELPGGYGKTVAIVNGNKLILMAHNSTLKVKQGDIVSPGQVVALSGNTGTSTGPHIHYEVRIGGIPVDPMRFK